MFLAIYLIEVDKMSTQEALNKFQKVYDETYDDVLKYLVCNVAKVSDAEDIIQDVYLALFKKIKKNINKEYVFGIARNKLKDYYRFTYKHKEKIMPSSAEVCKQVPDNLDFLNDMIIKENIGFIWTYLNKKKGVIGKIFFFYYYEDYSLKEIAQTLDISEGNVKHYLYRTLKEIKEQLEEENNE